VNAREGGASAVRALVPAAGARMTTHHLNSFLAKSPISLFQRRSAAQTQASASALEHGCIYTTSDWGAGGQGFWGVQTDGKGRGPAAPATASEEAIP
jgi:hypothetical protein